MNEIALTLGSERHLAATLTLPHGSTPPEVAVILMNAGVIHRMGPHRLNVKIARALAQANIPSLRLDLSGQGDSRSPLKAIERPQQVILDLKAAMDHVQRICSIQRFVIVGVCSGAFNGLALAQEDPRVAGLWLLDGPVFSTRKTNWVRYAHQLKARPVQALWTWGMRALRTPLWLLKAASTASTAPPVAGQQLSQSAFAATLQQLVDRGTAIRLVYSGSMYWSYNHATQFADAFAGHPFVAQVRCDLLADVDHTGSTRAGQLKLIHNVLDWMREWTPAPTQAREAHPVDAAKKPAGMPVANSQVS